MYASIRVCCDCKYIVEEATPATTTTVVVSTDIPDPTPQDDSSGGFPQLLGTILGSGLMGLVIILGLVLMLFFVLWAIQKHRKTQEKTSTAVISTERNLSNPLYAQGQCPLHGMASCSTYVSIMKIVFFQNQMDICTRQLRILNTNHLPSPSQ